MSNVSDPALTVEAAEREDARDIAYASQWRLVFIRLRRHRLAIVSGIVLAALYLMAAFAPFLSPHDPTEKSLEYREAPPQRVHFFSDQWAAPAPVRVSVHRRHRPGELQARLPRGPRAALPVALLRARLPVQAAVRVGVGTSTCSPPACAEVPVHLLGTDHLGRDMLARVM